jgi:hypothetical protein
VVIVEGEVSDEMVRAVTSLMTGRAAAAPVAAVAAAPVTEAPRLLPAAPARRAGAGKLKHTPPKAEGEGGEAGVESLANGRDPGQRLAVLGMLRRRPMTSGELLKAFPTVRPSHMYYLLSAMRKEGTIRVSEDQADGQRKNYLAA